MPIDPLGADAAARIDDRLRQLLRIGSGDEERGADRPAFSREDQQAHALVAEWMVEAGLDVELDAAGNLWGWLEGDDPAQAAVWTGSHLDAVPGGGRFDGVLGVVAALEAVATLRAAGSCRRTIAVVCFRDEEGWRFGHSFYGSRWIAGTLSREVGTLRDRDGMTLADARTALGLLADPPPSDRRPPSAFVELHVEQGPRLAQAGRAVGVVTSIVGMAERSVSFHGQTGHAGTVPMDGRRDPMAALAHYATGLFAAASALPEAVATIGSVTATPGAANVIPDVVRSSTDVRCATAEGLASLLESVDRVAREAARLTGCTVDVVAHDAVAPARMDDGVVDALEAAAREVCGVAPTRLSSGAGHDAGVIAAAGIPTGMVFVRSGAGGISHAPQETSASEDVLVATVVLARALRHLAGR